MKSKKKKKSTQNSKLTAPAPSPSDTLNALLLIEAVSYSVQAHPGDPGRVLVAMGEDAGRRFIERFAREKSRLHEPLEIVKFVCKELWMELYKKQVDNLRTNHKGVYVLTDNRFKAVAHLSGPAGASAAVRDLAEKFLFFPCGFLQGVFRAFGMEAEVSADVAAVPTGKITLYKFFFSFY